MKKYTLIGAAVLALVFLGLFLLPSPPDLEKFQPMYDRGLYAEVSSGLATALEDNPDWQEGRVLLVQAALNNGRLDTALANLAVLKDAGFLTENLEYQLDAWLQDNIPAKEHAEALAATVRELAETKADWHWVRQFNLKVLVKLGKGANLLEAMELLASLPPECFNSFELITAADNAWQIVAGEGDYASLWRVSIVLDLAHGQDFWRQRFLYANLDQAAYQELHAQDPGDAFLVLATTWGMEPHDALARLREWEQDYPVSPDSEEFYSLFKRSMIIRDVSTLEPADLIRVKPHHLLEAAIDSVLNVRKCGIILDRLEETGEFAQEVRTLRGVLKNPKPYQVLAGVMQPYYYSALFSSRLSPNGKNVVAVINNREGVIYNLAAGTQHSLESPDFSGSWTWVWAPDSSLVVMADIRQPKAIRIYTAKGELLHHLEFADSMYAPLGWYDEETLWVQAVALDGQYYGRAMLCDVESGNIREAQGLAQIPSFPGRTTFIPGPKGNLAWYDQSGYAMLRDGEVMEGDRPIEIISWSPNGSGVLVKLIQKLFLWEGGELKPLGIGGDFLGWRNDREFYWVSKFSDGMDWDAKLMGYDLKTGKTQDYNLVGSWAAAAGDKAVVSAGQEIVIYSVP